MLQAFNYHFRTESKGFPSRPTSFPSHLRHCPCSGSIGAITQFWCSPRPEHSSNNIPGASAQSCLGTPRHPDDIPSIDPPRPNLSATCPDTNNTVETHTARRSKDMVDSQTPTEARLGATELPTHTVELVTHHESARALVLNRQLTSVLARAESASAFAAWRFKLLATLPVFNKRPLTPSSLRRWTAQP